MYNLEEVTPKSTDECIVPKYGHRNPDGYVRVLNKPRSQGGKLMMHHRKVWEESFGPIPDNCEINHKCKNRECSNIEHLECLPVSVHRAKDNSLRYKSRAESLVEYKAQNPDVTQKVLASLFAISQAGVSKILQRYNKV